MPLLREWVEGFEFIYIFSYFQMSAYYLSKCGGVRLTSVGSQWLGVDFVAPGIILNVWFSVSKLSNFLLYTRLGQTEEQ